MKKTIVSALLATILFSSALPMSSFAEELAQEPTESSEQVQTPTEETTPSTSESTAQESTTESSTPDSTGTTTEPSVTPTQPEQPTVQQPQQQAPQETPQTPAQPVVETPVAEPTAPIHFEKNESTEDFVVKVGEEARKVGQENDLYASVMIAQAILESGSGSSQLAQEPYNNLFGIKGDYNGQSVSFATHEDDGTGTLYQVESSFRQYPSVKESFEDYSDLLKEGITGNEAIYQGAWKTVAPTYQDATRALTGVYATDTQYNEKLNELIETYNLTEYDHEKGDFVAGGDYESYNNVNYDTNNSYAWGNCTQYVYNRITQLGGHVDLDMGNGADWGVTGRARGYEVSTTPKAGTAVSFNPSVLGADSTYGHVAFVEKVNEDGSLLISEMNAKGLNVVSTRTIPSAYANLLTYITPK